MKRSSHAALVFANENFLSHKTMNMLSDIKHQLLGLLASIGFVPDMPALRKKMWKDSVESLTGEEVSSIVILTLTCRFKGYISLIVDLVLQTQSLKILD
jgi:hypothetical protein